MTGRESLIAFRRPLWLRRLVWHLDGHAGRSIKFWIGVKGLRYRVAVGIARRLRRRGQHTQDIYEPVGGRCLCDRAGRRYDFIPF